MNKRREIILAKVFFSDSHESKIRPAIILSGDKYHSIDFLLVAAITTSNDEHCILISDKDSNCKLEEGSSARSDGIIKIHSRQIIKKIGRISPEFHSNLVEKIISLLK